MTGEFKIFVLRQETLVRMTFCVRVHKPIKFQMLRFILLNYQTTVLNYTFTLSVYLPQIIYKKKKKVHFVLVPSHVYSENKIS